MGRSNNRHTTSYLAKARAIRKALPGIKLPKPSTPAKKREISALHKDLFGAGRRRGRLNLEHTIIKTRSKEELETYVKALGLKRQNKRIAKAGYVITEQTGKYKILKRSGDVVFTKGNARLITPRQLQRKPKSQEELLDSIREAWKKRKKNQHAILLINDRQFGGGEFDELPGLLEEIQLRMEKRVVSFNLFMSGQMRVAFFEPINQVNGRTYTELKHASRYEKKKRKKTRRRNRRRN